MKYLILAAIALIGLACSSHSQTIKFLGYDTTNGRVIYGGTNTLTFTNPLQFESGIRAATRTNLGSTSIGDSVFTAASAAAAATTIGLGTTNSPTFSNLTLNGTLGVSNAATFSTNVTVNGNISVGSLTTTTPSTWALDAVQTGSAGPTTYTLTLPDNGNVLRLTNNYPIRQISNGRLGAFYYLINQSGSPITIDHTNGITVQGGTSLTLGVNQAATLVATGATNASVAARGDLNDVALGGTANTAPSQTASSGSSLMTRDLGDARYLPSLGEYMDGTYYRQTMTDWMPTTATNGAYAAFEATGSRWVLYAETNAGSFVGVRVGRMESFEHGGASGQNKMWNSGFTAFVYLSAYSRSNRVLRFVVGPDINDPIGQYPTNRAVGIEFSGDASSLSARLIAHNGTAATNGPLLTGLRSEPYAFFDLYAVRYYTSGTVELYRSAARGPFTNIAAATISGGPTNNPSGNTFGAVDVAYDSGTNALPNSTATRIQWWGYQYHD